MPELTMCVGCHASDQTPYFASSDVEEAHQAIIDGNKVDFDDIGNSRLVLRLVEDEHNCGGDCQAKGQKLLDAITIWQEGIASVAEQSVDGKLRTIGHSIAKRKAYYDVGRLVGEEYEGGYIMMLATITPLDDVDGGISLSNLHISAHEHTIYLKKVKPLIDGKWQSVNTVFAPRGCGLAPPGGVVPSGKDTTIAFTPKEDNNSELAFEFAELRIAERGETLTLCNGEEIIVGEEDEEEEDEEKKKTATTMRPPPSPTPSPPANVSPQEQAYDNNDGDVKNILTSRCVGCHGYASNFNGIWNKRTAIKDRISRAAGAMGVMPEGSRLPQEQIDAILEWLK